MIQDNAVIWERGVRVTGYDQTLGLRSGKLRTWVVVKVTPTGEADSPLLLDLMEEGDYNTTSSLPCGFHGVVRTGLNISGMDFRSAMVRSIQLTRCSKGSFPWDPYA